MNKFVCILVICTLTISCATKPNVEEGYYYSQYYLPQSIDSLNNLCAISLDSSYLEIFLETIPIHNTDDSTRWRRVIDRNITSEIFFKLSKKIKGRQVLTSKLCISRQGDVLAVRVLRASDNFNEKDYPLWLKHMSNYKFSENESAPCIECGEHRLIIDNYYKINLKGF